ncbi:ATP-binding protein [Streptomyces sp. H27-D2]|uniref:ATP-binding protein n=1 Tax=Streptomyces sp. H27-D2 TaxID=3046304 RepID=UPI002DBE9FAE|nr:ATP-binding protein [Streptomyces sp. H27-D2]MEC4016653.1 ATP-binding protein [Streptomyces sp. H27-D2]
MKSGEGDAHGPSVARRWARNARCVGMARADLRKTLSEWGLESVQDPAAVVLSELLTNAVRHAHVPPGREIETRYARADDGVRIEVHDAAREHPELRAPDVEAANGRGLLIVAELSDRWGVNDRDGVGKSVWAVVTPAGAGRWS